MYFKESASGQEHELPAFSTSFKVIMVVNALLILALGIHPDWLTNLL
jgi:formate hydrogenlyase subunit 3/multisubunit Na+/H+ antiporter MnhD subunit